LAIEAERFLTAIRPDLPSVSIANRVCISHPMSWNYRILQHRHPAGDTVALHEVFYEEDGSISAWSVEPECGHFESVDELERSLERMLNDVRRFKEAVLERDSLPGAA